MIILYQLVIFLIKVVLYVGQFFSPKVAAFVKGRKNIFKELRAAFPATPQKLIWVHCASLGEFEQGRPLIEKFKTEFPEYKILLTFFSPSGYEVRKNYKQADYVFYMPLDSYINAKKFLSITKPSLVIFIKYEFWYYYAREIKKRNIPLLSVSSIFRKDQLFFQFYGVFYRNILRKFTHFFVQNETSVKLLKSISIHNCTMAGDTRFDRVYEVVKNRKHIPIVEKFKGTDKVFVIGSCWPDDLDVLIPFINENYYQVKFIIAPHEITDTFIKEIRGSLQLHSIPYSLADETMDFSEIQVLIIDNIGLLSHLYYYGEFAFVGGGFGKGLHNILEAACFGVPIFFGNRNYQKYNEAVELVMRGGAFEVEDYPDLKIKYEMTNIPENFLLACEVTRLYVEENLGATEKVMEYCKTTLN